LLRRGGAVIDSACVQIKAHNEVIAHRV
jgi:hypothetical protein